jgi:hypothetical protein
VTIGRSPRGSPSTSSTPLRRGTRDAGDSISIVEQTGVRSPSARRRASGRRAASQHRGERQGIYGRRVRGEIKRSDAVASEAGPASLRSSGGLRFTRSFRSGRDQHAPTLANY